MSDIDDIGVVEGTIPEEQVAERKLTAVSIAGVKYFERLLLLLRKFLKPHPMLEDAIDVGLCSVSTNVSS